MNYIKPLDTLRAIAVFIVVFHHLPVLPFQTPLSSIFKGITGVDIFFIISGFLITTILLHTKNNTHNIKQSLLSFYIRRFLRIFPLYYSVIFTLFILNPHNYRDYFIYDLLYISNFYMGIKGDFTTVTPHFWSLAVEEQFYLFWPVLLFIIPKTKEWMLFLVVFICGLAAYFYYENNNPFYGARTFVNLIYLSSGALWAYLKYHNLFVMELKKTAVTYIFLFVTLGFILFMYAFQIPDYLNKVINFLFSFFMVVYFSLTELKVLSNRITVYLGKISYGIYVFHFLMIFPFVIIFKYTYPDVLHNLYISNIIKIAMCIVVSALSWRYFESKILRYKDKFIYFT